MTAREIAVEVMRLAGNDVGDRVAVQIVEHRVRASLTRRVGLVERVALGTHRKGWRVVQQSPRPLRPCLKLSL
jgi:hypothetical protein